MIKLGIQTGIHYQPNHKLTYYHNSKKKYLERKLTYNSFTTVLRQICNFNNITYTTSASNSAFNWNFPTHGDMAQVNLRDKTNNRFYRITMMIGISYTSNFISIERLF